MNSLFSVKEKVILLTGGYGILGACMAKHLARRRRVRRNPRTKRAKKDLPWSMKLKRKGRGLILGFKRIG